MLRTFFTSQSIGVVGVRRLIDASLVEHADDRAVRHELAFGFVAAARVLIDADIAVLHELRVHHRDDVDEALGRPCGPSPCPRCRRCGVGGMGARFGPSCIATTGEELRSRSRVGITTSLRMKISLGRTVAVGRVHLRRHWRDGWGRDDWGLLRERDSGDGDERCSALRRVSACGAYEWPPQRKAILSASVLEPVARLEHPAYHAEQDGDEDRRDAKAEDDIVALQAEEGPSGSRISGARPGSAGRRRAEQLRAAASNRAERAAEEGQRRHDQHWDEVQLFEALRPDSRSSEAEQAEGEGHKDQEQSPSRPDAGSWQARKQVSRSRG